MKEVMDSEEIVVYFQEESWVANKAKTVFARRYYYCVRA
jgi:hypothetical protein